MVLQRGALPSFHQPLRLSHALFASPGAGWAERAFLVQIIEKAFAEVMRKEPERQARLKAEAEEKDRERRQALLLHQANEHKRSEERR